MLRKPGRACCLRGYGKSQKVRAPLVKLDVFVSQGASHDVVKKRYTCAVPEFCTREYDVILPQEVVRELRSRAVVVGVSCCYATVVCDKGTCTEDPSIRGEIHDAPCSVNVVFLLSVIMLCVACVSLIMLFAIFITVCYGVQHSNNGVSNGTRTAKGCADTLANGCDYIQWFAPVPVFANCDLY